MKSAADALKNAHKGMDVDNVHDMMDDIAEQQDVAKEIAEAIANPVAFGAGKDFFLYFFLDHFNFKTFRWWAYEAARNFAQLKKSVLKMNCCS